jgi:hypothetical protein
VSRPSSARGRSVPAIATLSASEQASSRATELGQAMHTLLMRSRGQNSNASSVLNEGSISSRAASKQRSVPMVIEVGRVQVAQITTDGRLEYEGG